MTLSNMLFICGAITVAFIFFKKAVNAHVFVFLLDRRKAIQLAATIADVLILSTWVSYAVTTGWSDGVVIGFIIFGVWATGFSVRRYFLDVLSNKYGELCDRYNDQRLDHLHNYFHDNDVLDINIERVNYHTTKYREKYLWSPLHWLCPVKNAFDPGMMTKLDLFEKSGTFIVTPSKRHINLYLTWQHSDQQQPN